MKLSILIISYNTQKLTTETILSVAETLKESPQLLKETELIVVDNHSNDESVIALKKLQKNLLLPLHLIENKENSGFAAANNQAMAKAQGEYYLLLNSDTVVQPKALELLVAALDKTKSNEASAVLSSHHGQLDHLGIVAAQLLNPDRSPQAQGGSFPTLLSLATHMLLLDDIPIVGAWLPSTQHTGRNQRPRATQSLIQQDWVGATAMLVKKEVIKEIGNLDENIFMYGEDVEFCLRAKKHHWDIAIHPQAHVVHYGSASSSSETAIAGEMKGYLYIWAKHKPAWQNGIVKWLLKTGCLLRMVIFGTILGNLTKGSLYRRIWESL